MARRFAKGRRRGRRGGGPAEGALQALAREIGGLAVACDVAGRPHGQVVRRAEERFGPVDVFCSDAGLVREGDEEASDADWAINWSVRLVSRLRRRAVVKKMAERGSGYLLNTASAAGLLTSDARPYAVTKHAAVALAEWLAINYGGHGVNVSCLCPQAVRTTSSGPRAWATGPAPTASSSRRRSPRRGGHHGRGGVPRPPPSPGADYMRRKAADYDRWLGGVRRLPARCAASDAGPR